MRRLAVFLLDALGEAAEEPGKKGKVSFQPQKWEARRKGGEKRMLFANGMPFLTLK